MLEHLWFTIGILLLISTLIYQILPLSFTLVPDRVSIFFLIPFSIFIANIVDKMNRRDLLSIITIVVIVIFTLNAIELTSTKEINFKSSPYGIDRTKISIDNIYELTIFQTKFGPLLLYTSGMKSDSLVTAQDIKAFEWIKENTNTGDIFLNNFDAGNWIPAIAYRPVLLGHLSYNFKAEIDEKYNLSTFCTIDYDYSTTSSYSCDYSKLKNISKLKARNVKYIYFSKISSDEPIFTEQDFQDDNFKKVYDREGVKIYEIQ